MAARAALPALTVVLLNLLLLCAPARAELTTGDYALATLVSSRSELLAARVLLHSARTHGKLAESVSLLLLTEPGVPPSLAASAAAADNVTHIALPGHDGLTALFDLPYRRVLYVAPHALVTDELAPLLHCGGFCASFVIPCSFSPSLMLLSPNTTLHNALQARRTAAQAAAHGSSVECASPRPDWLGVDGCVLNAHFGKRLLNAPMFVPDGVAKGAPLPDAETPPPEDESHRLPMGCLVAHHYYYPRFRLEIPAAACGSVRLIDFSSPAFLRPTRWTSYPLAQLSWRWHAARAALPRARAMDAVHKSRAVTSAVGLFLMSALALAFVSRTSSSSSGPLSTTGAPAAPLVARACAATPRDAARVAPLVALAVGLPAAVAALAAAAAVVPSDLAPPTAFPLFLGWHLAFLVVALHATARLGIEPLARFAALAGEDDETEGADEAKDGHGALLPEMQTGGSGDPKTLQLQPQRERKQELHAQQQEQVQQQAGRKAGRLLCLPLTSLRRRRGAAAVALGAGLAALHAALVVAADVVRVQTIYDRVFCLVGAMGGYALALVAGLAGLSTVWMDAAAAEAAAK